MMMNYTDFQPYILPETDVWALPTQKAMELLEYLENEAGDMCPTCETRESKQYYRKSEKDIPKLSSRIQRKYQTETCCQIPSG